MSINDQCKFQADKPLIRQRITNNTLFFFIRNIFGKHIIILILRCYQRKNYERREKVDREREKIRKMEIKKKYIIIHSNDYKATLRLQNPTLD